MSSAYQQTPPDPFHLSRFVAAQQTTYEQALRELQRGRKDSHWMWFIFPQIDGLGSSSTARHYAIKSREEAQAYLAHPVLGPRLVECCDAILAVDGKSASAIFGYPDDLKLKSSATLFAQVAGRHLQFAQVLDKYFAGQIDQRTIELLSAIPPEIAEAQSRVSSDRLRR